MKYLISICVLTGLFSCGKYARLADNLQDVTFNYTAPYTIPKTDSVYDNLVLSMDDIETGIEQKLKDNNTSADLIEEIKVKNITLIIDSPLHQQFDPLTEVHVFISADGLPEVEVAYISGVTDDIEQILEMEIPDVDLKPYLLKNKFNSRVELKSDQMIPQATATHCDMKFTMKANALKR